MQSIISKGKDINEAINIGLGLLEATKKEVNIEIIQHETRGILGLGSKPAIVKLTKLDSSSNTFNKGAEDQFDLIEQIVSDIPEDQQFGPQEERFLDRNLDDKETDSFEGKVWVKNGQLQWQSSSTHIPMVTVNEGIKLYRHNIRIPEKTTFLSEKDSYEIKLENEEKQTDWKVSMDDLKLKVLLKVDPGYRIIRSLPDIEPNHHIELKANETKLINNTLDSGLILQKLNSLQVKQGINQDEIIKAIKTNNPGTFEIATGREPEPGKDGWIEIKIDMDTQNGPKEKEDGRVDYREVKKIPSVERGKVIALVHPPIPGKIGYTVTGEPIPSKQTFPIVLKVGKGVMTLDDKIVATESGRPFFEQRGQLVKVSIMPKLTHEGNVNLASGNIRFMGDVEILGEVEGKMVVEAEGDICVHESVNMAKLTSSGAIITYGNIIGSEISAGKNNMLVAELGHLLGILHQTIEKMIGVINQLTNSSAFKSNDISKGGLKPLIRILLDRKFMSFPPLARNYVDVVRRGENYLYDDDWREIATSLTQLFLSLTNEVISLERITDLSQKMKKLHEFSETSVEPDSYITIPTALNSTIYCSGNVIVLGQGCINTKIHAGGSLKITGTIRGGEVYGRHGVDINEAGSESGTSTLIVVPADQKIYINKAMEGTSIKIGNVKHTFSKTKYRVIARLDQEERMVFE